MYYQFLYLILSPIKAKVKRQTEKVVWVGGMKMPWNFQSVVSRPSFPRARAWMRTDAPEVAQQQQHNGARLWRSLARRLQEVRHASTPLDKCQWRFEAMMTGRVVE